MLENESLRWFLESPLSLIAVYNIVRVRASWQAYVRSFGIVVSII